MFHSETYEKADLNQYWYSEKTCETLLAAVSECISWKGARVAFLSTPSLFFSLSAEERKQCTLFEFDKSWESCSNVIFYDFNHPTNIDAKLHGKFDVIVIDPPFISQSVWESYAITAALLGVKEGAKFICTTVETNGELMERLFQCKETRFRPKIPKLVYQYNTFVNFESVNLAKINSELE